MGQDIRELVATLGGAFIARKDVKAQQSDDGSWRPVRDYKTKEAEPFTMADFEAHLDGSKTFGHYTVDSDGITKVFCYDIDLRKKSAPTDERQTTLKDFGLVDPRGCWDAHRADPKDKDFKAIADTLRFQMRCLAEGFAYRIHRMTGLHVAIVESGHKGLHVYGFTGPQPADGVRRVAQNILTSVGTWSNSKGQNFFMHDTDYDCFEIEVFPKQTDMENKDLGNLLAIPLGVHRVTGVRRNFVSVNVGMEQGWSYMSPMEALGGTLPWDSGLVARSASEVWRDVTGLEGDSDLQAGAGETSVPPPPPPAPPAPSPKKRQSRKKKQDFDPSTFELASPK